MKKTILALFYAGLAMTAPAVSLQAGDAAGISPVSVPLLENIPVMTGRPGQNWPGSRKYTYSQKQQGTVRIGCTSTHLWISLTAKHGSPDLFVNNVAEHDGPVYADDCLDVFLDTTGEKRGFYQIISNVRGTIFDHHIDNNGRPDLSWDSGARSAGSYGDHSFYIEMAIPLASLMPRDGKLALAIGCYTRWNLTGESILGQYHRPETWTVFQLPDRWYPVSLKKLYIPPYSGHQTLECIIENRENEPLLLTGICNDLPLKVKLSPGARRNLSIPITQKAGVLQNHKLILRHRNRDVLSACRILIPRPVLTAVPVSDIIYEGENITMQIMVHEKQTEPVRVQCSTDKINCSYKGTESVISYETIPSPWSLP